MLNRIKNQTGFTLLEVLVAGAILTIGLLGIAAMMTSAMRANSNSRRMTTATNLAQQRIEEMKNIPFENLFKTSATNSNNSSNVAPVNILGVAPVDNGVNPSPCTATYPCGDIKANDLIWTYSSDAAVDSITYKRIWTVERNPNINGNGNGSGDNNLDADEQRTVRVEAIVSWKDSTGKWHKVSTASIISG